MISKGSNHLSKSGNSSSLRNRNKKNNSQIEKSKSKNPEHSKNVPLTKSTSLSTKNVPTDFDPVTWKIIETLQSTVISESEKGLIISALENSVRLTITLPRSEVANPLQSDLVGTGDIDMKNNSARQKSESVCSASSFVDSYFTSCQIKVEQNNKTPNKGPDKTTDKSLNPLLLIFKKLHDQAVENERELLKVRKDFQKWKQKSTERDTKISSLTRDLEKSKNQYHQGQKKLQEQRYQLLDKERKLLELKERLDEEETLRQQTTDEKTKQQVQMNKKIKQEVTKAKEIEREKSKLEKDLELLEKEREKNEELRSKILKQEEEVDKLRLDRERKNMQIKEFKNEIGRLKQSEDKSKKVG